MRIHYANVLLASANPAEGPIGPAGLTWNGEPILDVWQAFAAEQSTVYGRGDGPVVFGFSSWWKFTSQAEVVFFCATHGRTLPLQDELVLTDDDATVALVMADAVRRVAITEVRGTSVLVQYQFTGTRFDSDSVPEPLEEGSTVKTKEIALSLNDEEKAVAWDIAFGAKPKFVKGEISSPSGGVAIQAVPRESTRTAAGVTFDFTAPIPATGYVLMVFAAL